MASRDLDSITDAILDEAIKIHRRFGPGLAESFYEIVLCRALIRRGHKVERQKGITFGYDGLIFENACRVDLLVDDVVVVELKSLEKTNAAHPKQLLTYLRVANLSLGLLINFGAPLLREGVKRVVNDLKSGRSQLRVNQPPTA